MLEVILHIIGILFVLFCIFLIIGLGINYFTDEKPEKKDDIIEIWFEEIKDDDNVGKGRHNSRNTDRRNKR